MLCVCGQRAEAATHKKKSHSSEGGSHSSSKSKHGGPGSSRHGSKHGGRTPKPGYSKKNTEPPKPVALRTGDFPAEMGSQVGAYNAELAEIDALRHKDAKMAQARGEVLKIKRDSFELYRNFISSMDTRRAEKVRKAVLAKGWYKGMPQIAFVVSMGLPDDIETIPQKNGDQLRLVYGKSSYFFEKGELRSIKKP
ncbi:MAG: hypothetical protein WCD79_03815 [Chthoniobacteraceae bacterium]